MRVLHIQKVAGIGGSERHLLSLLPGLADAGIDVRMCVATAGRAADFTDNLDALGISYSTTPAGFDLNPRLVAAVRREIRSYRPDIVHTHLIHADLHGQLAARLAGVPAVSSVHGTHGFYEREPYRSAARIAGRWPALTIAISRHVGRFLEDVRLSRRESIRVIPYGIDAGKWLASTSERASARAQLGLEPDDVALGVASRLVPHKGHSFLLRGHAAASGTVPRLQLLVARDGPLRPDLEREARDLGTGARFLGFVPDIRSFLNACDVLAFPTQPEFGEGFGLAALEAMASACPVVATAVASLPEVVGEDEAGVLVDPADVGGLATALVRLATSPQLRGELGERARARAIARFSLDAMIDRTVAAYEEIPAVRSQ